MRQEAAERLARRVDTLARGHANPAPVPVPRYRLPWAQLLQKALAADVLTATGAVAIAADS